MKEQGRFFEGQPHIRNDFEHGLVTASDKQIDSLTPVQARGSPAGVFRRMNERP